MTQRMFEAVLGAVICLAALGIFLWGIPAWVEPNDFAATAPDLLPRTATGVIAALGAMMVVHRLLFDTDRSSPIGIDVATFSLAVGTIGLFAIAVALMNAFGYLVGGPFIVAALMVFMGSRQWPTIAAVSIAAPLLLYGLFERLLGVPLP